MKVLEWYIDPNDTKDKNFAKYSYPNGIIICEIHINTRMVSVKNDTRPALAHTMPYSTA